MDRTKTINKLFDIHTTGKSRAEALKEKHHAFRKSLQHRRKHLSTRKGPNDFKEFQDYIDYMKKVQGV